MQVMTEQELKKTLSENIKKYRKNKFTQEKLAEKCGLSSQNINDIEGMRRWPRSENLVKIADALEVEVYQLFIPQTKKKVVIEKTDENISIQSQIQTKVIEEIRKVLNKSLDKMKKE